MPNFKLVNFIKKAKAIGYEDFDIRKALLNHGWKKEDVENAFEFLKKKKGHKNIIQIYVNDEVLKKLEKRASKNLLNLHEQIEDTLRRSVLNMKKSTTQEKIDDKFLTFFSRKKK